MFHDDMYGHVPNRRKPLATASLVFGILSIVLCSVIYLALPLGALAIIFAVLSHTEYKMAKKSRIGLVCGFCGIIATIAVTVFSFYYVLTNPTMRSYIEYYVQMYTGEEDFDLEEMLEDIIPGYLGSDDDTSNDNVTSDETTPSEDLYEIPSGEEAIPPVEIPQEGGKFL